MHLGSALLLGDALTAVVAYDNGRAMAARAAVLLVTTPGDAARAVGDRTGTTSPSAHERPGGHGPSKVGRVRRLSDEELGSIASDG
ncbi:MAG: hypothetical protein ACYCTE_12740 [Acidimicrobiales bacterium]